MAFRRPVVMTVATFGSVLAPSMVSASEPDAKPPQLTLLTSFGDGLGSGSTVGPDGALYVADGKAGSVLRIDLGTKEVTTLADGLPPQVLGIGGAIDVAFIADSAYVLVTMVGGDIVDGDPIGDDTVGIYRVEPDGSTTVIADIGAWSAAHPPATDFFITSGVQYALESDDSGFLVTDGHHNRVLRVGLDGGISELATYGNVVPTGLERDGDTVYVGEAGPVPHRPQDGKVVELGLDSSTTTEIASGASMIVDVELDDAGNLYALSQGEWDGVQEGSPASLNTGRLVLVGTDGTMTPVVDGAGDAFVLDRPTSLEFVGDSAYIVGFGGEVFEIEHLSMSPSLTAASVQT